LLVVGESHVLDFGLGERRAAVETPVHRFQPAIDYPFSRILPSVLISSASILYAIVV